MSALRRVGATLFGGPKGVRQASILLALTAFLSSILGLLRNVVFYRLIPFDQLDIYYASFRIPDFLFTILIFGALSSAFVPILSGMLAQGDKEKARKFSDQAFTWLTIVFGGIALVLVLAMDPLMRLVVHGFEPERFTQAVNLSRILMLQSLLFAWSFTCGGYLNSFKRFSSPAFAPLLYNGSIIIGAAFVEKHGLNAIALAVVIGATLHFGIQFWEMARTGYIPRFTLARSKELKDLVRLMLPRSISQGMNQFVLIIFTALASGLASGSIAILSGMNDLQTTPTVILVNSLAAALFPTLAGHVATNDWDEINRLIKKAFQVTLFVFIPGIIISYILRAQVVRLYTSIGGASWELTNLAIRTFIGFLVGIIPSALIILLSRLFYALKDTRTPMILSLIAGSFGIAWAYIGIHVFDGSVATLAYAGSAVAWIQCLLYIAVLKGHRRVQLGLTQLLPRLLHYVMAGLAAGFTTWLALHAIDALYAATNLLTTASVLGLLIQLIGALLVGGLTVLGYSKLVLTEELTWLAKSKRFTTSR